MTTDVVISLSDNTDIGEGWRVRAFSQSSDWNTLGRTLAETRFTSRAAAVEYVRDLATKYPGARVQGLEVK